MEGLVLGGLVGYGLTKLLDVVLEAIKHVKHRKKLFMALTSLLQRLKPFVVHTERLAKRVNVVKIWHEALEEKLLEAEVIVREYKQLGIARSIKGKRLLDVTAAIQELESQASMMVIAIEDDNAAALRVWQSGADEYLKEINEKLRALGKDVERIGFANGTRSVMNTPTSNFGSDVNTTTVTKAFVTIKNQSDAVTEISNRSNDGPLAQVPQISSLEVMQEDLGDPGNEIVFGGDANLERLKEMMLASEKHGKWVGVWSMGGAGKTLTTQRAYGDPEITRHFVGGTFWLSVGREKSTLDLLNQLYGAIVKRPGKLTKNNATDVVRRELSGKKKVLLVLDDVWTAEVRDCLDVVAESSSGVILVTTRNEEILNQVFARKLYISMLGEDDSWQLFCWHAFRGTNRVSSLLKDLAKKVAAECKGLPLALKVIGGSMAGKEKRAQWETALKRLKNADAISKEHQEQLFGRLQLSVDDLGDVNKYLVDCFYYFAAFPEDADVRVVEDLLGLWAADGILDRNSGLFPEEEAYELLGWLIARSLIELQAPLWEGGGNMQEKEYMTCKIHDVLRDLARNNLQRDLEPHQRLCLYQPGFQLKRFPERWTDPVSKASTSGSPALSVRRLSLMHNELEELPSKLSAPDLQVLLLGNNKRLQSLPTEFFGGLTQLRVLDLRRTAIMEIPAQGLTSLKSLVLLNLSNCSDLQKIPHSIKDLQNLRELRLEGCRKLKSLPADVLSLTKLEILATSQSTVWDNRRSRLSLANFSTPWIGHLLKWPYAWLGPLLSWTLPWMQRPSDWCHSWRAPATFEDVNLLTNLTHLEVSITSQSFRFSLSSLKLLRSLNVKFLDLEIFPDVHELVLLESLRIFSSKMAAPPRGLVALSNLKMLDLKGCSSLSSLPALDELPLLEYLDLGFCPELMQLPASFGRPGAFPSLLELTMNWCHNIDDEGFPCLQPGAMPELLLLNLSGWMKLRRVPLSLQVLRTLRVLILSACRNLETLEPTFALDCFPNLEELVLEGTTALVSLPSSLSSLPKLRKLDLQKCGAREEFAGELAQRFQILELLQ